MSTHTLILDRSIGTRVRGFEFLAARAEPVSCVLRWWSSPNSDADAAGDFVAFQGAHVSASPPKLLEMMILAGNYGHYDM